jgi:hypothetical protein
MDMKFVCGQIGFYPWGGGKQLASKTDLWFIILVPYETDNEIEEKKVYNLKYILLSNCTKRSLVWEVS